MKIIKKVFFFWLFYVLPISVAIAIPKVLIKMHAIGVFN